MKDTIIEKLKQVIKEIQQVLIILNSNSQIRLLIKTWHEKDIAVIHKRIEQLDSELSALQSEEQPQERFEVVNENCIQYNGNLYYQSRDDEPSEKSQPKAEAKGAEEIECPNPNCKHPKMERCSINYMCPECHTMLNGEILPNEYATQPLSSDIKCEQCGNTSKKEFHCRECGNNF